MINIIYRFDHCIVDKLCQWGHLLVYAVIHRYSSNAKINACCFYALCLCIICRISALLITLSSKYGISIIIRRCIFCPIVLFILVTDRVIRNLSFCFGCLMIFLFLSSIYLLLCHYCYCYCFQRLVDCGSWDLRLIFFYRWRNLCFSQFY